MTFSCPRLSCTVRRHAGPCARNTSATSGTAVRRGSALAAQLLQRTDHFAQQICCDLRIKRGRLQLLVAEQYLDDTDVDLLLQQMGRKAVAQRVHGDALVDIRCLGGGMDGAVELPRAERINRIEAGKQPAALQHPALRVRYAPPDAQAFEQDR